MEYKTTEHDDETSNFVEKLLCLIKEFSHPCDSPCFLRYFHSIKIKFLILNFSLQLSLNTLLHNDFI